MGAQKPFTYAKESSQEYFKNWGTNMRIYTQMDLAKSTKLDMLIIYILT